MTRYICVHCDKVVEVRSERAHVMHLCKKKLDRHKRPMDLPLIREWRGPR